MDGRTAPGAMYSEELSESRMLCVPLPVAGLLRWAHYLKGAKDIWGPALEWRVSWRGRGGRIRRVHNAATLVRKRNGICASACCASSFFV